MYFGSKSDMTLFEMRECATCFHRYAEQDARCPVLRVHDLFNDRQVEDDDWKLALRVLIPTGDVTEVECRMYVRDEA